MGHGTGEGLDVVWSQVRSSIDAFDYDTASDSTDRLRGPPLGSIQLGFKNRSDLAVRAARTAKSTLTFLVKSLG